MKLCFFHAGADLYGADNILFLIVEGLSAVGANITVYLPYEGPLATKLRNLSGVEVTIFPFAVLRRSAIRGFRGFNFAWSLCKSVWWCLREIKRIQPDVVHTNTLVVWPAAIASRLLGVPHIWHVHEIVRQPRILGWVLAHLALIFSNRVIAVSDAVKRQLVEYSPTLEDKIRIIHNGINATYFHPMNDSKSFRTEIGIPEGNILVGMIGRVNRIKGQSFFLDAIKQIQDQSNLNFAIVGGVFPGEEALFESLKEKILNLNIKNTHLIGFTPDVQTIHAAFDIFVLPSVKPDSFPTVVLEAMATGRPVIATRCGGVEEMLVDGETGVLVNWTDPSELASAIMKLATDSGLRLRMGERGRQRLLDRFSIDRFKADIIECFNEHLLSPEPTKSKISIQ